MKNLIKISILLLNALLLCSNLQSCNKKNQEYPASKKQTQGKPAPPTHISFFVPLTYEKFQAIRNNNDQFSCINIAYISKDSTKWSRLYLPAGDMGSTRYFSSLTKIEGGLSVELFNAPPPRHHGYDKTFTISDLNSILDYLAENSDYFFNGDEYSGLNLPVQSTDVLICHDNYSFGLAIYEPGSATNAWGIHKCVHDPPGNDSPLHDLFEMLDDDFVSQFTE